MRRPLSDDASNDVYAAVGARLAGPLVDAEMVLEIASAVDPIQACSIVPQSLPQQFIHSTRQITHSS